MNKSFITNIIALVIIFIGHLQHNALLFSAGLFAFSGAITNWLAIHMLFEKVPGLYGSGVIPERFESFKTAIKSLMMEQFFTEKNIQRFLNDEVSSTSSFDLQPVIEQVDFNPTFDSLVEVITASSFGGMLAMLGGAEALQPLKEPFIEQMQRSVVDISQSDKVKQAIQKQLGSNEMQHDIQARIEEIIDQRLNELTPKLVKEMVQKIIKEHLGWLVVWGGIFGGIIGVAAALI
jgi:uncharacterized membrane protein YheB (UPF0754 family)